MIGVRSLLPAMVLEDAGWPRKERLEQAGFFFPPAKAPGMKVSLRNMWSRLPLTTAEVRTFHGMLRQIAFKLGQAKSDPGEG